MLVSQKEYYLARAVQCWLTTGGLRWRKLGIFINSALACLLGTTWAFCWTTPCLTGRGTTAGWKVLTSKKTEYYEPIIREYYEQ